MKNITTTRTAMDPFAWIEKSSPEMRYRIMETATDAADKQAERGTKKWAKLHRTYVESLINAAAMASSDGVAADGACQIIAT